MGSVLGFLIKASKPLGAIVVLAVLAMSTVVLADIFGYDYKVYDGTYLKLWAYVDGYLQQDPYTGCLTGWIVDVWGTGGGWIESPASGSISVKTPPPVVWRRAETKVYGEAYAYIDGKLVEERKEIIARIVSIPGVCQSHKIMEVYKPFFN